MDKIKQDSSDRWWGENILSWKSEAYLIHPKDLPKAIQLKGRLEDQIVLIDEFIQKVKE